MCPACLDASQTQTEISAHDPKQIFGVSRQTLSELAQRGIIKIEARSVSLSAERPCVRRAPQGGEVNDLAAPKLNECTHKPTAKMLTWMCRPASVIGGKADMALTCQYVR
jgi:hypothetical protein